MYIFNDSTARITYMYLNVYQCISNNFNFVEYLPSDLSVGYEPGSGIPASQQDV